jgi:hypothetical protein
MSNCFNVKVFNASFVNGNIYKTDCIKSSLRIPCRIQCPKVSSLNKLIRDINHIEEPQLLPWNFKWFLWISIASWIGMAVVVSIGDAICFDLLSKEYFLLIIVFL